MKNLAILFGIFAALGGFLIVYMARLNDSSRGQVDGPIVFFGNSITAGVGANAGEDFPRLVGKELGVEIINAGVSGNTTGDALLRIESDVISKNPSIVVVEFGGNDFLQKVETAQTKRNLQEIVGKINQSGAKLVIIGVRRSILANDFEDFERDLAEKNQGVYVENILRGIIGDSQLMADAVHPSGEGHKRIAEKLVKVLEPMVR